MTNDRIVTGVKNLSGNDPWAQIAALMKKHGSKSVGIGRRQARAALQPKEGEG